MRLRIDPISTQWQNNDLSNLFTAFGEVSSAQVAIDVFTDQPRGFGDVTMPNEQEAHEAIRKLHNTEVNGKKVHVLETADQKFKGSYKVGSGNVVAFRFKK